jgi:ribosome maturation factor RimP
MSVADRVRDLVLPLLDDRHLDLYDVEMQGPVLRVVVDSPPGSHGALDLDALADATRAVSRALDEADPITGRYTLEVTSPGLERTLRRPEHFERAVGETVKIRTVAGVSDERRVEGQLVCADDAGVVVRTGVADDGTAVEQRLAYHDIERARTVFEWGPATPRSSGKRKSDEKRERRS